MGCCGWGNGGFLSADASARSVVDWVVCAVPILAGATVLVVEATVLNTTSTQKLSELNELVGKAVVLYPYTPFTPSVPFWSAVSGPFVTPDNSKQPAARNEVDARRIRIRDYVGGIGRNGDRCGEVSLLPPRKCLIAEDNSGEKRSALGPEHSGAGHGAIGEFVEANAENIARDFAAKLQSQLDRHAGRRSVGGDRAGIPYRAWAIPGRTSSERDAVFETPFSVAVMVADCGAVTVPAVAANVAEEAEARTVTEDGTDSKLLLSEIATERLVAVAELSVKVQVPVAPEDNMVGAQTNDVSVAGGIRLIEAVLALPLNAAVTMAA